MKDDLLEETIEQATADYAELLPDWLLDEIRDFLAVTLTSHPVASGLLEAGRPRTEPDRSGEVLKEGARAEEEAPSGDEKAS